MWLDKACCQATHPAPHFLMPRCVYSGSVGAWHFRTQAICGPAGSRAVPYGRSGLMVAHDRSRKVRVVPNLEASARLVHPSRRKDSQSSINRCQRSNGTSAGGLAGSSRASASDQARGAPALVQVSSTTVGSGLRQKRYKRPNVDPSIVRRGLSSLSSLLSAPPLMECSAV